MAKIPEMHPDVAPLMRKHHPSWGMNEAYEGIAQGKKSPALDRIVELTKTGKIRPMGGFASGQWSSYLATLRATGQVRAKPKEEAPAKEKMPEKPATKRETGIRGSWDEGARSFYGSEAGMARPSIPTAEGNARPSFDSIPAKQKAEWLVRHHLAYRGKPVADAEWDIRSGRADSSLVYIRELYNEGRLKATPEKEKPAGRMPFEKLTDVDRAFLLRKHAFNQGEGQVRTILHDWLPSGARESLLDPLRERYEKGEISVVPEEEKRKLLEEDWNRIPPMGKAYLLKEHVPSREKSDPEFLERDIKEGGVGVLMDLHYLKERWLQGKLLGKGK